MVKIVPFLFAALFALLAPSAALAQHDRMPAPHAKDMLPQLCLQLCFSAVNLCAPSAALDDPACVTRRVVCPTTCQACLAGREDCGSDTAKFNACLSDYGACIRVKAAERAQSRPQVSFGGGDGASKAAAVVISGARDENEGMTAERVWASTRHPDWKQKDRKRAAIEGRTFDAVDYDTAAGPSQAWFDVTAFAGAGEAPK